jgi:hypothetical protein
MCSSPHKVAMDAMSSVPREIDPPPRCTQMQVVVSYHPNTSRAVCTRRTSPIKRALQPMVPGVSIPKRPVQQPDHMQRRNRHAQANLPGTSSVAVVVPAHRNPRRRMYSSVPRNNPPCTIISHLPQMESTTCPAAVNYVQLNFVVPLCTRIPEARVHAKFSISRHSSAARAVGTVKRACVIVGLMEPALTPFSLAAQHGCLFLRSTCGCSERQSASCKLQHAICAPVHIIEDWRSHQR